MTRPVTTAQTSLTARRSETETGSIGLGCSTRVHVSSETLTRDIRGPVPGDINCRESHDLPRVSLTVLLIIHFAFSYEQQLLVVNFLCFDDKLIE